MRQPPFVSAPRPNARGFTLLELVLAIAVVGVLAAIATASYNSAVERGKVGRATADIAEIDLRIQRYRTQGAGFPATLAEVAPDKTADPWGRPYEYRVLLGPQGIGAARKDRRLNPLNSDYDLFSSGKNGVYKTQISQKDSLDDVIRARGGSFIGLAEDY